MGPTRTAAFAALLWSTDAAAFDLSASPLVRGAVATFTATGALRGARVVLVAGVASRPCDAAPECVVPGVVLGEAVADDDGTAVVRVRLHDRFPVGVFLFQARADGEGTPILRASVDTGQRVAARRAAP